MMLDAIEALPRLWRNFAFRVCLMRARYSYSRLSSAAGAEPCLSLYQPAPRIARRFCLNILDQRFSPQRPFAGALAAGAASRQCVIAARHAVLLSPRLGRHFHSEFEAAAFSLPGSLPEIVRPICKQINSNIFSFVICVISIAWDGFRLPLHFLRYQLASPLNRLARMPHAILALSFNIDAFQVKLDFSCRLGPASKTGVATR